MSVYVVTGGTGALGGSVVRRLLARGDRLAIPYRGGHAFQELLSIGSTEALYGAVADMSEPAAARKFCEAAAERFGRLDGAALLAGAYAGSSTFEAAPLSEWSEMIAANLQSVYASCRALLPHLSKGGGSVVTIGSKTASAGGAGAAAYAVSKTAVVALTRALALENKARGIRFNTVEPGTIDTPANRAAMPKADFSAWTPPEQIAEVIAFLLSPGSAPISGATIPVDGRGK
jgi:NAD(P)-dependent dehydrogenase (short-subunit alcohol dehydrogenase family)